VDLKEGSGVSAEALIDPEPLTLVNMLPATLTPHEAQMSLYLTLTPEEMKLHTIN